MSRRTSLFTVAAVDIAAPLKSRTPIRSRGLITVAAVDLVAVLFVGWLAATTNQSGPPLAAGEVALPAVSEDVVSCAEPYVDPGWVIRGDPQDARIVWLADARDGARTDVIWPKGYRARFTPNLVVLNDRDEPVATGGVAYHGDCGDIDGYRLLAPPFD
jgi:hypothetical protein